MDISEVITVLNEAGDIDAARAVEKLLEERDAAVQYIPHRCNTCRYRHLWTHRCDRCYIWDTSGWGWNGKPPEKDINRLWNWL